MCSTYRMPIARPKQFPSGFLVAALLAANGLLWAVMFFGPLAHLERLASGLTPFDIRPRGYSSARFSTLSGRKAADTTPVQSWSSTRSIRRFMRCRVGWRCGG